MFVDFLTSGKFDNVSLDSVNSEKLIKLMDWYVVRLEGGTEEDASKLLSDEPLLRPRIAPKQTEEVEKEKEKPVVKKADANGSGDKESGESSESGGSDGDSGAEEGSRKKKQKARPASTMDALEAELDSNSKSGDKDDTMDAEDGASNDVKKRGTKRRRSGSEGSSGMSDGENSDGEAKEDKEDDKPAEGENSNGSLEKKGKKPLLATPGAEKKKLIVLDEDDELPQLHRSASVFLRNLAPSITKAEVEGLCKKYSGYLRTAIADPQPEKRWARRAWVTFKRNVNIKGKYRFLHSLIFNFDLFFDL